MIQLLVKKENFRDVLIALGGKVNPPDENWKVTTYSPPKNKTMELRWLRVEGEPGGCEITIK